MRFTRLLAVLGVGATLACGGDDTTDPGTNGGDFTVTVGSSTFTPSSLSVPVGSTVTWQWNSSGVEHNVTFQDGSPGASSRASGSFPRTFSTAGNFPYLCTLHPGMAGQVTVTAGSTGGGGGGGGGGAYP